MTRRKTSADFISERIKALVWCALFALATPALAHDFRVGNLRVEHPWSKATPPGAPGVGYMTIINDGDEPDRLVSFNAEFARVSAHRTSIKDGVVSMTRVSEGVVIPAGKTVSFQPGGLHLMLMNLSGPLRPEEEIPITLNFEKAGPITVIYNVIGSGETMDHAH